MPINSRPRRLRPISPIRIISPSQNIRLHSCSIGTGFFRTGTDTLKDALNILGYRTYHMKELVTNRLSDHMETWTYLIENDCDTPDAEELLRKMFRQLNFTATVGINFPCNERLIEMYPNAKIVHTQRTNSSLWHESVSATMCTMLSSRLMKIAMYVSPTFRKLNKLGRTQFTKMLRRSDGDADDENRGADGTLVDINPDFCRDRRDEMIAVYEAHNARTVEISPKDRLLVITNHRGGWEPLVEFLGKPMPDVPFPHSNSRNAFVKMGHVSQDIEKYGGLVVAMIVVVGYVLRRAMTRGKDTTKAKTA